MKIPERFSKPLITRNLTIKVPHGVDPDGVAVDVPAAMKAAANPKPGDSSDFDLRLLIHLMRRQMSKLDPKAVGDPDEYVRRMRIGLDPRDSFEEVLCGSILLAYGRLAHLSHAASQITDQYDLLPLYNAAERTANSIRKHIVCLAEYRAGNAVAGMEPEKNVKINERTEIRPCAESAIS